MRANDRVASVFERIAAFLEHEGGNPYRVRAYRAAADSVRAWPRELAEMLRTGDSLLAIPGIGIDLAAKARDVVKTGDTVFLSAGGHPVSTALLALFKVRGLGPRRVAVLHEELGIRTLGQLKRATEAGLVRRLPGFGPGIERRITEAFAEMTGMPVRGLGADAYPRPNQRRQHA